ncbi:radical SAM protein [Aerosakkonema sp. BLCC-F183]|uniref:radical SAM protein n=1 Tax=Aerosakkonema sp. BLCC-F183 TaxID=3342834 RepID=UPI0035B96816
MTLTNHKTSSIGLVELPVQSLIDSEGGDWALPSCYPLSSKQVLMASLQAGGFDAQLVDLRVGDYVEEYGTVTWRGEKLTKRYEGTKISSLDPQVYDAWGVTSNYMQYRPQALEAIRHLSSAGKPVVVGGSDAFALPQLYLEAGASAIVTDKTGGANWAIFDYVLNRPIREKLTGVILADGSQFPQRLPPMTPQDWPLPSVDVARQCLGVDLFKHAQSETEKRVGSVIFDIGCDRKCDFCQTPTYKMGYGRMTPARARQWLAIQKEAGAESFQCYSDQFLARLLFKDGRQEVLDIMQAVRDVGVNVSWINGLELKKATKGRGYERESEDLIPDEELVQALWGWDGKVGCNWAYIPAERPVFGRESYAKLLPWQQHREMMRAIVRTGIPRIEYGFIIGLAEDSHETMLRLEEAFTELYQDLKSINPSLIMLTLPLAISPIPGTPQDELIRKSGLLKFDDPEIIGGFWTVCADTYHMSYEEVADWQLRLMRIGDIIPIFEQLPALRLSRKIAKAGNFRF